MKTSTTSLMLIAVIMLFACQSKTEENVVPSSIKTEQAPRRDSTKRVDQQPVPEGAIRGDFNNDGKTEFAWLVAPVVNDEEMNCDGDCVSYISFSDPSIPQIKIESCIGGTPDNLGDLNKDGSDEIGLLPSWFTSCWKGYFVWTMKKGEWIQAIDPIETHCDQWDKGVIPIEIDEDQPGHVLIRYSEFSDAGIFVKTKSVPIK